MKKILVTGASGMIGRRVMAAFGRENGVQAVGASGPRIDGANVSLDLRDAQSIRALIARTRPDIVVHLAGVIGSRGESPEDFTTVNVEGTRHLAEHASSFGVDRFVFASSAAVYGDERPGRLAETVELRPSGAYGRSKAEAESVLAEISAHSGMSVIVLRIFNVHGDPNSTSLVERLKHSTPESPVALRGPEHFVRDYVHVDDVARAIVLASMATLQPGPHVANVGTGVGTPTSELVATLSASGPVFTTVDPGAPSWSVAEISTAAQLLGFRAERTTA